jgi:hypothetical protein
MAMNEIFIRRGRRLVSVLSLGLIALAACSAAPTERSASSGEDLIVSPIGIVDLPPVCTFQTPAAPSPKEVIIGWAAPLSVGGCPEVPGVGGVWAEVNSIPEPAGVPRGWVGVPAYDAPFSTAADVPNCASAYPPGILAPACCTYVWWPDGFQSDPTETNPAVQDAQALCTKNGLTFIALTGGPLCSWEQEPDGGERPWCGSPGGGGCIPCTPID